MFNETKLMTCDQKRSDNVIKYLNTFFPNVLSRLITDYDYYYDEKGYQKMTPPELDINRLFFKSIEISQESILYTCFVRYLYNYDLPPTQENLETKTRPVILITKPIKMMKGGIPRYNGQFFNGPDDPRRAYFYIPKTHESEELFDCIQTIDDYMHNEINVNMNKNKIVCVLRNYKKIALKGMTYRRMITTVRPPQGFGYDDDDDEDTKKKNPRRGEEKFVQWDRRIRVKFETVYDLNLGLNDPKEISTKLFIGNREKAEPCTTISHIERYFTWASTVQFALMFSKLWIHPRRKECGISIKCVQLCVTQLRAARNIIPITEQLKKRLFPISNVRDDEDEVTQKNHTIQSQ